ncbi:hypothetical protein [Paenibacillus camerounensis]|uniref:hypothetical protein n=1 Tax=Paenibacillus camerounensis TaxID=1243663 RepID=UPI0005A68118|nr:hypothetical protein [Paenibacillus camerounensis]
MFEWIQGHSIVEYCSRQEHMNLGDRSRFVMHTVTTDTPSGMTALAQYFTAGSVLLDLDFNITVPVPDEQLLQQVMGHGLVYVVNLLVQPAITKWEGFADAKLYSLGEDTDFADFDPGTAECLEGTSLIFDEDSLQRMMDEVNQALKFG